MTDSPHSGLALKHEDPPWLPEQSAEWGLSPSIQTGALSGAGRTCIMDIEGDGILHASGYKKAVSQLWCIACVDVDTEEQFYWGADLGPRSLALGVKFMSECKMLLGHNAIGYDYPALKRLYKWNPVGVTLWDTLVIAKVIWPAESLMDRDMALYRAGKLPGHLLKSHSLKAWGIRTGTHKGDYTGGFDEWCPAMAVYLMGDIKATLALWKKCRERMGWDNPTEGQLVWKPLTVETECAVASIIHQQTEYGVRFDLPKAHALAATLRNDQARIEEELVGIFGSWWEPLDDPKEGRAAGSTMQRALVEHPSIARPRYGKRGARLADYVGPPKEDITEGSASVRIERTTFNPGNRHHIAKRLQAQFGWKPKAFGANGVATVDETTLEEIPDAVMPSATRQMLLDYFVISKTLATLAGGQRSWIKRCGHEPYLNDGRVHGEMDTCGAVTRRGTHKNPNLSGCPSVTLEKDADGKEHPVKGLAGRYGWECRELFCADEGGWELTGVDASSLELIDLGHYLYSRDEGRFSARVCDPGRDAHREHAELAGSGMSRADAKTTIYLKVYGGTAYKLSLALTVDDAEVPTLLGYKGLKALLNSIERRFGKDFVLALDDRQKAKIAKARIIITKLEKAVVGLPELTKDIQEKAEAQGWLKAIDGSRIIVRKAYAALNTLLQSAGAITCKMWLVEMHKEMGRRGYVLGKDWKQVLWIHDEAQVTHRPGLGPVVIEVAEQSIVRVGETLGLKGRYRTAGATGTNWATTH